MASRLDLGKLGILLAATAISACPHRALDDVRALAAAGQKKEAAALALATAKADPANLAAWDAAVDLWCNQLVVVGECLNVLDLELDLLGNVQRHKDALSDVLVRRARARLADGLPKAALMDLDRAAKAGPKRAGVHIARAEVYASLGERSRAVQALERARKIDPNHHGIDHAAKLIPEAPADGEAFGGD